LVNHNVPALKTGHTDNWEVQTILICDGIKTGLLGNAKQWRVLKKVIVDNIITLESTTPPHCYLYHAEGRFLLGETT
jgi:hypothetical protein